MWTAGGGRGTKATWDSSETDIGTLYVDSKKDGEKAMPIKIIKPVVMTKMILTRNLNMIKYFLLEKKPVSQPHQETLLQFVDVYKADVSEPYS